MIKFFRKIRQNLLSEGKTAKYFKYAIGEIILLVIRILATINVKFKNETYPSLEGIKGWVILWEKSFPIIQNLLATPKSYIRLKRPIILVKMVKAASF